MRSPSPSSASSASSASAARGLQLVALLVDLMHGDLVAGDPRCRHVADALLAAHGAALCRLVAGAPALPPDLRGALSAYGARHALRVAPELLAASRETAAAYAEIAAVLRGADGLAGIGAAMDEALARLAVRVEARAWRETMELLGSAVVAYMARAAKEYESGNGAALPLMDCVVRFAASAARDGRTPSGSRSGGKRGRTEGDAEERKGKEMGKEDERMEEGEEEVESSAGRRNLSVGASTENELTPRQQFPNELRLAMTSPSPKRHEVKPQPRNRVEPQQEQQQKPVQKSVPRVLRHVDDSVLSAVGNLHSDAGRDVSSIVVADDSTLQSAPLSRPGRHIAGEEHVRSAADASLLGTDVQVRSYFLCHKINRYEPMVAKGFYD